MGILQNRSFTDRYRASAENYREAFPIAWSDLKAGLVHAMKLEPKLAPICKDYLNAAKRQEKKDGTVNRILVLSALAILAILVVLWFFLTHG